MVILVVAVSVGVYKLRSQNDEQVSAKNDRKVTEPTELSERQF